jgi:hypothetical protein
MSRKIHDADFEKYEGDELERVDDGCPAGMSVDHEDVSGGDALDLGFTRENWMDKIFSDPLLDIAASLDAGETPYRPESRDEGSRKYIAEYLKKHHLLGVTECSNCGKLNYEGDEHCSRCGISFKKP